jgi:hypothetical protein
MIFEKNDSNIIEVLEMFASMVMLENNINYILESHLTV